MHCEPRSFIQSPNNNGGAFSSATDNVMIAMLLFACVVSFVSSIIAVINISSLEQRVNNVESSMYAKERAPQEDEKIEEEEEEEDDEEPAEISDADLIEHVRKVDVKNALDETVVEEKKEATPVPSNMSEEQNALHSLMEALLNKDVSNLTGHVKARDELGKGQAGIEILADRLVRITKGMAQKMEESTEMDQKEKEPWVKMLKDMPMYVQQIVDCSDKSLVGDIKEGEANVLDMEALGKIFNCAKNAEVNKQDVEAEAKILLNAMDKLREAKSDSKSHEDVD